MLRLAAAYRVEAMLVVALVGSSVVAQALLLPSLFYGVVGLIALTALRAVLMAALYFRLRRLGYGLEFALLAAIPFGATLAFTSYILAFPYLAEIGLDTLNLALFLRLVIPLTTTILLAVFYYYVRRAQGGIIERACGLLLAASVVELAIVAYQLAPDLRIPAPYVTAALLLGVYAYIWRLRLNLTRLVCAAAFAAAVVHVVFAMPDFPVGISISARQFIYSDRGIISGFSTMLLALWFARSASKLSLVHAFFITALVFTFPLSALLTEGSVRQSAMPSQTLTLSVVMSAMAMAALSIVTNLAAVWLLGNFNRRGPAFNTRATAALFGIKAAIGVAAVVLLIAEGGVTIAPDAPLVIGVIIGWGVTLALVYLIRVRQPAPERENA